MVVHGKRLWCGCRFALRIVTTFALLSLPGFLTPKLLAQRFGVEFQVNTYTTGFQGLPSVAASAAGAFVIVWESEQDGQGDGVFGRRFSSTGAPLASEFQINTFTAGTIQFPSVAAAPNGDFLVAWGDLSQGAPVDVFARLYSSAGASLTGEIPVHEFVSGTQSLPRVAAMGQAGFVIAWASNAQDGSSNGVFARRFTTAGAPIASEFQVNSYTTGAQGNPVVAAGASGDFVVVWHSIGGQDGMDTGVFAQRFSSEGAALGSEFQVNAYTVSTQYFPAVAAAASGNFIVTWAGTGEGDTGGIFARRFSNAGAALGSEFRVNTHVADQQSFPMVAAGIDGDFAIVWESFNQDSSDFGIFGRSYSSAGVALASEFQVNTYISGLQRYPQVAAANGNFVVAWGSNYQDGENYGIFAQRFALLKTIDIDGDGLVLPLTDGILLLRFTFGFSGEVLTDGAVNTEACMRCDAATIEPYLQTLVN